VTEIGGEIRVRLYPDGARIGAVEILSTRPRDAARIFVGKPVSDTCATIGRVFSLCGTAQTVAALRAAEQALAMPASAPVDAARDLAMLAEMLTQTAMRLALHWPRVLGLPLQPELVRACLVVERRIEAEVLGAGWRAPGAGLAAPDAGLAEMLDALAPELAAADPGAPLAVELEARALLGYGALPVGQPPEAGALARRWNTPAVIAARAAHGAGLGARLAASQEELAALPSAMRAALDRTRPAPSRSATRDSGQGAAMVETARGPLRHAMNVEAGIVTACRTEAPTEENFSDHGPVARGLHGAKPDPVAAELHVLAIDPCVACTVEIVGP
jgi:coenzyme F420-reducing hydrogenase alpha subunit